MTFTLVLRVAILSCIFLGVLLAIIAVAGKEWEKYEIDFIDFKATFGLWDYCTRGSQTSVYFSVNDLLKQWESSKLIKSSAKSKYLFL